MCNSQRATGTKVHVYTLNYHIGGNFILALYLVPLGLISIYLYVGRIQISCGLLPTRFFFNFPVKTLLLY